MVILLYKWLLLAGWMGGLAGKSNEIGVKPVFHPFYVSVTEINYNAADKSLEIACKVFTEDFEGALKKMNNTLVDIYHPKDSVQLDKFITAYLQRHLQLKVDGKPVNLEYVGHEIEEQSTWNYVQVSNITNQPRKIEIANTIFHEMFDKQINIMHVTVGGNRKSTKLDFPASDVKFDF